MPDRCPSEDGGETGRGCGGGEFGDDPSPTGPGGRGVRSRGEEEECKKEERRRRGIKEEEE